jgi:hypothetical protein
VSDLVHLRRETIDALLESASLDNRTEELNRDSYWRYLRGQAHGGCAHRFELIRACRWCGLEEGSPS